MVKNFDSVYKQKNVFRRYLDLVEPEKVIITTSIKSKKMDDNFELIETPHYGYYVSMKQALENLIETLPSPYFSKPVNKIGLKSDIFDGLYIKDKIKNDNTLVITIYSDDADPVNAIGPHKKKHKESKIKLTMLYTFSCIFKIF